MGGKQQRRWLSSRQVNLGTQLKGPPCSAPWKSHTKGHLGECPLWQTLLTKEQPDLPTAEFSIQQSAGLAAPGPGPDPTGRQPGPAWEFSPGGRH